ncbi:MAG: glycyl-radical enzyme activating protein [Salinivirgaceae bacterium]|nr:glycyl-radical enzyme activating protein [Salinivirgaceae bacterium]MDD4746485.1 glycyl-radical enzyme activating protein [Salinivirgaceae bacterium]MDY0280773.1 glycyl-radical enzyme activating protein [Salinivirgaceae bacterium]
MEGIIFDYKHFSVNDGPGIRLTVFLKGCPLRCKWCHNPESFSCAIETWNQTDHLDGQSFLRNIQVGQQVDIESLMKVVMADSLFFSKSGGGVTFSGGEPMMQPEFLVEALKECIKQGIHTCVDTSGFAKTGQFRSVLKYTDLVLFDLKVMDSTIHKQITGVDNYLILNNLSVAVQNKVPVRIRIPLIPDITDTPSNLEAILEFIKPLDSIQGIDLLPYHSMSKSKHAKLNIDFAMEGVENYPIDKANKIADYFRKWFSDVTVGG